MRIRLYREGYSTVDQRMLCATTWDDPCPLLNYPPDMDDDQTGHWGAELAGMVREIRREAEGWVTGELDYDGPVSGLAAEPDFDAGTFELRGDGVLYNTGARLRAVTLGFKPAWHDMRID
jgi:hypothetical protein